MNVYVLVALLSCVSMATCFHVNKRLKRADEYFIEYISTKTGNIETKQTVIIQDQEVKLKVENGITAVLDYKMMLMTMKKEPDSKFCATVHFNAENVPTLEKIKETVNAQLEIELPTKEMKMSLQKAKDQTRPDLSPLSDQLCQGLEVEMFEISDDTRQKRDVGWGEVVVIIIIIIILF